MSFLYTILYIVLLPLLLVILNIGHKRTLYMRALERYQKNPSLKKPKTLMYSINRALRFTISNKSKVALPQMSKKKEQKFLPGQDRFYLISIYLFGLTLSLVSDFTQKPSFFLMSIAVFFVSIFYSLITSRKPLENRDKLFRKMAEVASSGLGLDKKKALEDPYSIVNVTKWANPLQPTEIKFPIPMTFDHFAGPSFIEKFNQFFGRSYTWVTNGDEGWDYEENIVTLTAVAPLPNKAPWSEHYVLTKGIAPSFFPIALGSENGVEIPNPHRNGEVENVLGFDVQGTMMNSKEFKVGPEISASPQGLVGGGTGGGKAAAITTPIRYFVKKDKISKG